jgi:multidrug resistance efflux pump
MNSTSSMDRSRSENGTVSLGERVRSLRLNDRPMQGGKRNSVIPWALCVILLAMTAGFGYRAYRITSAAPVSEDVRPTDTASFQSTQPTAAVGEVVLPAKGYVIPAHQVQVSPKVGGQILYLNPRFKEGEFFEKGAVLAALETDDYQAEVDHAQHAVETAERRHRELSRYLKKEAEQTRLELEEARRTMAQLEREAARTRRLVAQNAIDQREYEQAKFSHEAMQQRVNRLEIAYDLMVEGPRKERIAAARGDWLAAQADLRKAEWRLKNCQIKAPISGYVLTKKAEKGNVVNPLAFNVAASLCDMADLGDLEVDLNIQERDIAVVYQGQQCAIMPEAFQNHEPFRKLHPRGYTGEVSRLMPTADRAKGAIPVRVKIHVPSDEVGKYLRPDMSVMVSFLKGSQGAGKKSQGGSPQGLAAPR